MSLTFPSNYEAALFNRSLKEDWIFKFFYGAEGANDFIGLSMKDRIVSSVQYYGKIQNISPIYKSIDLVNSRASTSDLTVTCLNDYAGGKLSEQLYGGTNDYINRKVLIYSCLNDEDTLSNCMLLQDYRLVHISHGLDTVTLTLEERTPWDFIIIPNTKNDLNEWVPVVYGDYTPESSSPGSENFLEEKRLHPAPVVAVRSDDIAAHVTRNIASNANPHHYEKSIDGFAPLNPADNDAEAYKSSYVITAPLNMRRAFKFRPLIDVDKGANEFTNPGNAYDDDATNYASVTESLGDNESIAYYLYLKLPQIPGGKFTDINLSIKYYAECDDYNGSGLISLYDISYGTGGTEQHEIFTLTAVGTSDGTSYVNKAWDTAARYNNNNKMPDDIELKATFQTGSSGSDSIGGYIYIYDVLIYGTIELTFDANNFESSMAFVNQIDKLYCGGDGLQKAYSGGSGTATLAHEVHRDMMDRYAGFDYADAYMKNWSTLNTDRSGWNVRLWHLEPIALKEILERLQYEGGFIFSPYPDADGSGNPGGIYIHVEDSYSSGDVVFTLDEDDYQNINVDLSHFKDIMSKGIYNFQRHPAESRYLQSDTFTNSNRGDWNYATEENIAEINLDYLVNCGDNTEDIYDTASADGDNAPSESICVYYDRINGESKIIVTCDIVDKAKFKLDYGDIVKFNDSNIDPFGKSWSALYFMVVDTERSPGNLRITAREVYST